MVSIPRQPLFKRHHTFVVVKPIRLSAKETLEPGTVIEPGEWPTYRLLHWHRRRRIGVKDSPWVAHMLEAFKKTLPKKGKKVKPGEQPAEDEEEPSSDEAVDAEGQGDDEEEDILEINQDGSTYTAILNGEELVKIKGKKKFNAWLIQNGYDKI